MSGVAQGRVKKYLVKEGTFKSGKNKGKNWYLHSFTLEDDDRFFDLGFQNKAKKDPLEEFEEGKGVKFSFEEEEYNGKPKYVVDADSVVEFTVPDKEPAGGKDATPRGDEYWDAKNAKLQWQGCRKDAIAIFTVLAEKDVLPFAKSKKAGDAFDLCLAEIDRITLELFLRQEEVQERVAEASDAPFSMDDIDDSDDAEDDL